jgi:hypothetical protein
MDETYYTLDNDPDFLNNTIDNHHNICESFKLKFDKGIIKYDDDICIEKGFIYKKGFIRFELYNNNPEYVLSVINIIRGIIINFYKIELGKNIIRNGISPIYTINLRLNIALLEEYGRTIDLINAEELLAQYTDEEMDNLIVHKNNNDYNINTKYIFNDKKGFYLDVPLLEEFYNNNAIINNIDHQYNKLYNIKTQYTSTRSFKHFKRISIGYEKLTMITKYSTPLIIDHTLDKISTMSYTVVLNDVKIMLYEELMHRYRGYRRIYKNIYIIIPMNIDNPILIKPHDIVVYEFNDYIMYKINHDPNITELELEFDFIKNHFSIYVIETHVV